MKSNRDCKIVEDLLPNYIEGLTNEVTNYYIEEHIQSCEHCQEVIKAMQEQINAEKVDGKEEIDYLKKINHKTKKTERIATISIIISVLLFIIVAFPIFPKYMWNKNNSGNINFFSNLFSEQEQTEQWTYYVAEKTIYDAENSLNGESYKEIRIMQINQKSNELENYKIVVKGVRNEYLKEHVKILQSMVDSKINGIKNLQFKEYSYSFDNLIDVETLKMSDITEVLLKYDDDGIIEKY